MAREPIFIGNLSDDLHCLQACIRMFGETIGRPISWAEADAITGFQKDLYTWPARSIIELNTLFPGTRYWTDFDYGRFCREGRAYLLSYFHGDVAWVDDQEAHASPGFEKEMRDAQRMVEAQLVERRNPSASDWKDILAAHYVIAFVDSGVLHERERGIGHSVLLYGVDGGELLLHDPGLPPRPSVRVPVERFMKAYRNGATVIPLPNR
ncbi:hypothetical protein EPO33_01855 [Patescibacteria group bacterium]|nr:MAG: hypothetical protein EPO33_01855 [Patescibacteria group bacterium]